MRVLILGGAGMVGRNLAARLVADGSLGGTPVEEVTLFDVVPASTLGSDRTAITVRTGDIADEHDEPGPPQMVERPDGTLDVDARTPIAAFEERFGPVLTNEERAADIDTVGGLVFTLAGRVPARGELVSHPSGLEFRVLDADPRRIRRLRVRRPGAQAPAEGQKQAAE